MIRKPYPNGKLNAFNVTTYDDGVLQDIRFVAFLNCGYMEKEL